jgi:hypothetical protein
MTYDTYLHAQHPRAFNIQQWYAIHWEVYVYVCIMLIGVVWVYVCICSIMVYMVYNCVYYCVY